MALCPLPRVTMPTWKRLRAVPIPSLRWRYRMRTPGGQSAPQDIGRSPMYNCALRPFRIRNNLHWNRRATVEDFGAAVADRTKSPGCSDQGMSGTGNIEKKRGLNVPAGCRARTNSRSALRLLLSGKRENFSGADRRTDIESFQLKNARVILRHKTATDPVLVDIDVA